MDTVPLLRTALFWTAVLIPDLVSAFEGQINITAGQDVTLPCRAPNINQTIVVMEWSRADQQAEYVLSYRDDQFDPDYQHPSFKNRVDLQDRQMKDGDVSVILKNVTVNDTGTYECRVVQRGTNRKKRAHLKTDPISIISLSVVPPGHTGGATEDGGKEDGGKEDGGKKDGGKEDGGKEDGGKEDGGKKDGSVGLIIGLVVLAVLLVAAVVGFLLYRNHHQQQQNQDSYQPPVETL